MQSAFPAQWFTAYSALFPAIGLFVTVVDVMRSIIVHLMPASRHQNHAASPSASDIVRLATSPRPSHPAPNVRDDREAPLLAGAGRGTFVMIWVKDQRTHLRQINTTGKSLEVRKNLSRIFDTMRREAIASPTLLLREALARMSIENIDVCPGPLGRKPELTPAASRSGRNSFCCAVQP